jgi:putative colanic acid biosynthesis UDP-glucose lipid carrier transferase
LSRLHLWIDILLLNFSYILAGSLKLGASYFETDIQYINTLLIANLLWIFFIYVVNPYVFTRSSHNGYGHFGKHLFTIVVHYAALEIVLNFGNFTSAHIEQIVFSGLKFFALFSVLAHVSVILVIRYLRKSGYNVKRYAVIGSKHFNAWSNHLSQDRQIGYQFCGVFKFANQPGQLESLEQFMEAEQLDFIYCCLSQMNTEQITGVLKLAERKKTQVRLVPDFQSSIAKKLDLEVLESFPIIDIDNKPLSEGDAQEVKRTFDVIFSLTTMVLGLPIFVLVAILVKLSSKGPIFFLQERTGRWGKKFKIIKFRTMYVDAEKYGLQHSIGKKDPRITPIGSFLRKTRLDELPQFLNVLKSDMSVVGPRPLHHYDVEMLMKGASHEFQKALMIRPGITSIGQIKVGYATNPAENLSRLRYDLLYLNAYSLRKDLYLIFLTIQVILLGKGR